MAKYLGAHPLREELNMESGGSPINYTPQSCSGLPLIKQTLPAVIPMETRWPQPPPASAKLLRSYWGTWLKAWLPCNIFVKDM